VSLIEFIVFTISILRKIKWILCIYLKINIINKGIEIKNLFDNKINSKLVNFYKD